MVYAADDDTMGRRVAIKVMMGDLEDEPEMRERFYPRGENHRPARPPQHRHRFDLGEDNGHPFIVMELLAGFALPSHLRPRRALRSTPRSI